MRVDHLQRFDEALRVLMATDHDVAFLLRDQAVERVVPPLPLEDAFGLLVRFIGRQHHEPVARLVVERLGMCGREEDARRPVQSGPFIKL
jgi:hypothetical protein